MSLKIPLLAVLLLVPSACTTIVGLDHALVTTPPG